MPAAAQAKRSSFYRTYKFRKNEQDPAMDVVFSLMDRHGYDIKRLAGETGISFSALKNWDDGVTRCPQHRTLGAAIAAMGYEFAVVKMSRNVNGHGIKAEPPKFIKRYKTTTLPSI